MRIRKRMTAGLLACGMALSLTACGNGGTESLDRKVSPQPVEIREITREDRLAAGDFAFRLLQETAEPGENVLVSPLSVLTALAMTANGAREETLAEMAAVLGLDTETLNTFLHSYLSGLPEEKQCRLLPANSVWFRDREGLTVEPEFLQTVADHYGAELRKAPFDNDTCREINRWVEEKTLGMIPEIIGELSPETVMLLINALAFEADWAEPYENPAGEGSFFCSDGAAVGAEFLWSSEQTWLENELATGFVKPYAGGRFGFLALLPREGTAPEEVLAGLDGEAFLALLEGAEETEVVTATPRFTAEYSASLRPALAAMGMPAAFDRDRADFTGLGSDAAGRLFISDVLHRTFLELGEKGTRAGAVTAVVVECESMAPVEEPRKVILDRPFVYGIVDLEAEIPVFLGALNSLG